MTDTERLIKRYGLILNTRGSSLEIPTLRFFNGHTMADYYTISPPESFVYMEPWSNGYRQVYVNREELAIFTYCEGDLDITVDDTPEEFERRLASAAKFYDEVA